MNELKSIEKEFQRIKNQSNDEKNDLKICYKTVQDISNIINRINNISDKIVQKNKHKLIEIYQKERKSYINNIINLSYMYFMDEDSEIDYKLLVHDIQNSLFYEEIKNNYKLKEMEIKYIMLEAEENKDYNTALEKLKDIDELVFDLNLKNEINEDINNCQNAIANIKIKDIQNLLENNKFDDAINNFLDLLNNEKLFKYTYKKFLGTLENIIKIKLNDKINDIPEIKIYKDFITKNKDRIKGYMRYLYKLEKLEPYINFIKNEEKNEIKNDNIGISFIDKNQKEIERKDIDYYLDQIEKNIPEEELEEFDELREYIYKQISDYNNESKNNYINSKKWISDRNRYKGIINDINNIGKIYSYLNYINKDIKHYDIYTIQLISLLILTQKLPKKTKGIFCKINTGEGKSTIIQFFAAYKVLSGHKVDIVSSSTVLAERDGEKDKEKVLFYKQLGISVGVLKNKIKPYSCDIIYGDSTSFCADILQDEYEFKHWRNDRGFDIIIIDEVDNMCIDNLSSKTQLTKRFSGYQSLYTFYYIIILCFNFVADELKLISDPEVIKNNREKIKKKILQKLKDMPIDLESGLNNELDVMAAVEKYLIETKNSRNVQYKEKKSSSSKSTGVSSLDNNKEENNQNIKNKKIEKLLTEDGKIFEMDGKNLAGILFPNCLKEEIEKHIENWIDSVITAFTMVENIDYRIIKSGNYRKIVPIDFVNTGVTQLNMVWHDALHQALQIINDIEIFPENLNTNFLYMITFFQKYNELYGLTGTIGTKTNQITLQDLYKVKIYFIPPNIKSKLIKRNEYVFTNEMQWEKKIINEIKEILEENRSVLLICRSIKEGQYFLKIIKENDIKNIKLYFTEDDEESMEEYLKPKYVIIATNLAGRGTDIKLTKELKNSGGLHVIVSFLPLNQRIEEQNYGRAGRNGQKGSYSLIFTYLADKNNPLLTVESIKKKRENDEKEKFRCFKEYDEIKMKNEISLFKDYTKFRFILHKNGDKFIMEDNEYYWGLILNSDLSFNEKKYRLEKLKENEKSIINPLMKIKYFVSQDNIEKFQKEDEILFEKEKFYSWPLKMQYAALLSENKEIEKARQYYEEVIENLKDYQYDIQNQTVIHLLIFKSLQKNEKFDLKKYRTKIDLQNERKKKFIQAIIDINNNNLEILRDYDNLEENEVSYIERADTININNICQKLNLDKEKNLEEIKDLQNFSLEFGIEKFDKLRIVKRPNFWKNYVVLTIGVVEVVMCGVLCVVGTFTGQVKIIDFGLFLITQGFNDIVESFQAAINGKEMNLLKWGGKKLIEYTKGIIKIAIGSSSFTGSIGSSLTNMVKDEIISITKNYAIEKASEFAYNQLLTKGRNKLLDLCNNFIGKPILNKIISKSSKKIKYIVIDLVHEQKLFKEYIIEKTNKMFEYFKTYSTALNKIRKTFDSVKKEKSMAWKAIQIIIDSIFLFKDLYPSFKEIGKKILNKDEGFIYDSVSEYKIFDGSLRSLIEIEYQTDEDNSSDNINEICKELIKYNVISKSGKFDLEQINNESLEQIISLEINEEFKSITVSNKKFMESSDIILDFDNQMKSNYIKYLQKKSGAFGKSNIENYKKDLSEELTKTVFKNVKFIFDELMKILVNKVKEKIREYQEKKRLKEELKKKTEEIDKRDNLFKKWKEKQNNNNDKIKEKQEDKQKEKKTNIYKNKNTNFNKNNEKKVQEKLNIKPIIITKEEQNRKDIKEKQIEIKSNVDNNINNKISENNNINIKNNNEDEFSSYMLDGDSEEEDMIYRIEYWDKKIREEDEENKRITSNNLNENNNN